MFSAHNTKYHHHYAASHAARRMLSQLSLPSLYHHYRHHHYYHATFIITLSGGRVITLYRAISRHKCKVSCFSSAPRVGVPHSSPSHFTQHWRIARHITAHVGPGYGWAGAAYFQSSLIPSLPQYQYHVIRRGVRSCTHAHTLRKGYASFIACMPPNIIGNGGQPPGARHSSHFHNIIYCFSRRCTGAIISLCVELFYVLGTSGRKGTVCITSHQ